MPVYCNPCGRKSDKISLKKSAINRDRRMELNGIDEAIERLSDLRSQTVESYEKRVDELERQRRPFCGCCGKPVGDCLRTTNWGRPVTG